MPYLFSKMIMITSCKLRSQISGRTVDKWT